MGAFILVCLSIAATIALSSGVPLNYELYEIAEEDQICKPGTLNLNDQYSCYCLADGSGFACTLKTTTPTTPTPTTTPSNPFHQPCNPADYNGYMGCLRCRCDGGACVLQGCDYEQPRRHCEPGQKEFDGCNTCVCNIEGTGKQCTKNYCG